MQIINASTCSKCIGESTDNEAEIVEMRRLGAKGDAEHSAWMDGLCPKNKQKMESDTALSGTKMHGCGDELRHKNECAEVNASHGAEMAQIERNLSAARQNRADNLWRPGQRPNGCDCDKN